jgi:O-antigen/teichoic acid export membrane protein
MVVAVPTMAVYWFVCPWILGNQFPDQGWVPGVFALYIPLAVYAGLLLSIYQGCGDFIRWNIGRLFRNSTWTLLLIVLAAVASVTVLNLLLVQISILAVLGIYLFSQLGHLKGRNRGEGTAPIGRVFKYGFAVYISTIAYSVTQQFDQLLLSLWVSPSELGEYMVGATVAGSILLIPSAVGPIVFSKIAGAIDGLTEQRHHIWLAFHLIVKVMVPAGLCLMILAPWVTQILYGPAYVNAGEVLRVLAPAAIFLGAGFTLSDILRGAGKPMYATYGALAGAVITIGGLVWALPRFGIWGAAWVSFIAYGAMMLIQSFFLWRWISKAHLSSRTLTTS